MAERELDRIDLPDGAGGIVLYDWMSDDMNDGRNLVNIDSQGRIVWKASPPGTQDSFTHMTWDDETLAANTWSGYRVGVEMQNGRVTVREFTK